MTWTSVKDHKPDEQEWVIIGSSIHETTSWAVYLDGEFVNPDLNYFKIEGVTHWMPLPEPPKENE